MAKYKQFAKQGSFAENQLKVPDETGKIKEQTQRTVRGMNTAQAFLQKNQEIYLRAQQQANEVEQQTRENNFQFETQNRKAFQDALRRDTEIALRNDQIRANETQQFYKDLSSFSNTAFELAGQFEENRQKKLQTLAIQNVMEAGVDYKTLYEVSKLDRNLSSSAFRQTEVVKNFIDSGASEDQVRSLYNLARNNPPQRYLNTQAAYQQEYLKYPIAADKIIQELGPDATPEQVQARLRSFTSEYITENLPNARPEMLEKSGLLRQIRSYGTQIVSGISREAAAKRKKEIPLQYQENLQTEFVKSGGIDAVMQQIQTDPARWKRESLADWTENGLKSGMVSPEEAQQILDYPLTIGNQTTTIAKQYPDIAAQLVSAIRTSKRQSVSDYNYSQTQREMEANAQLAQLADSFGVDEDGIFDENEVNEIKNRAIQLGVSDSPVVDFVVENSAPEFIRRQQESQLTALLDAGRYKEAMDILSTTQVSQKIKNQFLPTVQNMMKLYDTPVVKSHIKSIEAAVSEEERVKAAGASNYSVILMQDKYKRQYKQNLARLKSPEEALSLTLQQIKTLQETPGAITPEGRYSEIENQIKEDAQEAGQSLNNYNKLLGEIIKPEFRNNPKYAFNAVGHANFHEAYNAMYAGKEAPPMIKAGAALMGVDPLTFINYLASGIDVDPIEPKDTLLRDIKASVPPIIRRLYDTYRTNERTTRANTTVIGRLNQSPKRGAFSNEPFDMSTLNQKDYNDLAFAISSEAALGTDDEFGVAANIITRLMTGRYGNSISEIINAPGQYEGVYSGLSRPSPEIAARLQSLEGQKKILEFIKILNGRTEFKGQSQLKNRVPSEDPMFAVNGNFYHYAGQ
ncbi:hypothetical protein [Synechococcus phage S-B28]|uniref:Uncharacterized protein n=1 Tax=Synechococcus phage S-B28 TaxID=2545435 RepID=A0A482IGM1_9CAUD|nr:hypothetical protein HOV28_gp16 [Synechococcus phage S-B28]QBP05811.1 hypothetical protein [Synechococcus phage S-B28]